MSDWWKLAAVCTYVVIAVIFYDHLNPIIWFIGQLSGKIDLIAVYEIDIRSIEG